MYHIKNMPYYYQTETNKNVINKALCIDVSCGLDNGDLCRTAGIDCNCDGSHDVLILVHIHHAYSYQLCESRI